MYISELELENFRNYEHLKVSFSRDINIFLGENAQGKTNLLEGIYLNAVARSFKTTRDREMIRFGEEYCKVRAVAHYDDDEHISEIVISQGGAKAVKVDGVKISKTSELLDRLHIIVFSPEDLKIVKDEPGKRRGFINRELCQIRPGYVNELNTYRRVLRQRNAYLKEEFSDDQILDIWDYEMIKSAGRIIRARKDFLRRIDEISRDIHSSISGGRENLQLQYEASVNCEYGEEENEYRRMLEEGRERDRQYRSTHLGPHRDDIRIIADDIDLRKYGSQGQQRTAALSLKLSEIVITEEETGEKPILLLDDVLSELDNERQKYLISCLGNNQLFITTTDRICRQISSGGKGISDQKRSGGNRNIIEENTKYCALKRRNNSWKSLSF